MLAGVYKQRIIDLVSPVNMPICPFSNEPVQVNFILSNYLSGSLLTVSALIFVLLVYDLLPVSVLRFVLHLRGGYFKINFNQYK